MSIDNELASQLFGIDEENFCNLFSPGIENINIEEIARNNQNKTPYDRVIEDIKKSIDDINAA